MPEVKGYVLFSMYYKLFQFLYIILYYIIIYILLYFFHGVIIITETGGQSQGNFPPSLSFHIKHAWTSSFKKGQRGCSREVLLRILSTAFKRCHADKLWTFLLPVMFSKSH